VFPAEQEIISMYGFEPKKVPDETNYQYPEYCERTAHALLF